MTPSHPPLSDTSIHSICSSRAMGGTIVEREEELISFALSNEDD